MEIVTFTSRDEKLKSVITQISANEFRVELYRLIDDVYTLDTGDEFYYETNDAADAVDIARHFTNDVNCTSRVCPTCGQGY
jgi:hypothetical protein